VQSLCEPSELPRSVGKLDAELSFHIPFLLN